MAILFVLSGTTAFSQKYKTASDTVKLNKEYVEISEDVADLTNKLNTAQGKLPGYQNKASEAVSDAHQTAIKSSEQSSKAIDGDVGDARKANRKAKKALRDAKDVEDAKDEVKDQDRKISRLNSQLQKKQKKLEELESMRSAIRNLPPQ